MSWKSSGRRTELPSNWSSIRRDIIKRDPFCTMCGNWWSTDVDHIRRGSDHSPANLRGVCSACHGRKSAGEGVAARARLRALRKRPPEKHPGNWD